MVGAASVTHAFERRSAGAIRSERAERIICFSARFWPLRGNPVASGVGVFERNRLGAKAVRFRVGAFKLRADAIGPAVGLRHVRSLRRRLKYLRMMASDGMPL